MATERVRQLRVRDVADPLITVIVPLFNRCDLISETLASIEAQTLANRIETIVVDDGSTDNSAAIVLGRKTGAGGLILLQTVNQGASAARNTGLAACRTPYLSFLDSDDLIHSEKMARQWQALQERPNADYATCDYAIFEGALANVVKAFTNQGRPAWPLLPDFLRGRCFHTGNALYRLAVCRKTGPWPERLRTSEDWAWHIAMGAVGATGIHVPIRMLYVREHQDTGRLSRIQNRGKFVQEYCQYAQFIVRRLRKDACVWRQHGPLACQTLFRGAIWSLREKQEERGMLFIRRALALQPSPLRRGLYFAVYLLMRVAGPLRVIWLYDRLRRSIRVASAIFVPARAC